MPLAFSKVPKQVSDAKEPKKMIMKQHVNLTLAELLEEDKTAVLVRTHSSIGAHTQCCVTLLYTVLHTETHIRTYVGGAGHWQERWELRYNKTIMTSQYKRTAKSLKTKATHAHNRRH
jgi:hypothetical protein